jgi:hypothetical protein
VSSSGQRAWRNWLVVMAGDVVRDGGGRPWRVERVAVEPGSRDGDGTLIAWVQLGDGGAERVMRVPDATRQVELDEGPGWGIDGAGDAAMDWATGLVAQRLGGTVLDMSMD